MEIHKNSWHYRLYEVEFPGRYWNIVRYVYVARVVYAVLVLVFLVVASGAVFLAINFVTVLLGFGIASLFSRKEFLQTSFRVKGWRGGKVYLAWYVIPLWVLVAIAAGFWFSSPLSLSEVEDFFRTLNSDLLVIAAGIAFISAYFAYEYAMDKLRVRGPNRLSGGGKFSFGGSWCRLKAFCKKKKEYFYTPIEFVDSSPEE